MSFEILNLKDANSKKNPEQTKTLSSFNAQWSYNPPLRPSTQERKVEVTQQTSPKSKLSKRSISQIPSAYQNNRGILIPREIHSSQSDFNLVVRTPILSRKSVRPVTEGTDMKSFREHKKRSTLLNLLSDENNNNNNLPAVKKKSPGYKLVIPFKHDLNKLIDQRAIKASNEEFFENLSYSSQVNSAKNLSTAENVIKPNGSLVRRKIKEQDIEIFQPKYKIIDLPARWKEFQNLNKSKSAGVLLEKFIKNKLKVQVEATEGENCVNEKTIPKTVRNHDSIEKTQESDGSLHLSQKYKIIIKKKLEEGKFLEKPVVEEKFESEQNKNNALGIKFSLKMNENKRKTMLFERKDEPIVIPTQEIETFEDENNTVEKTDSEEGTVENEKSPVPDPGTPTVANFEKRITVLIDSYKKTPFFNTNYIGPEIENKEEGFKIRQSVQVEAAKKENRFAKHFPSVKFRISEIYSNKQMREIRSDVKRLKRTRYEILKSIKETLIYISSLKLTIEEVRKKNVFSFKPFQKPFAYQFIRSVKIGDYATMITLLAANKYLVYDYDYVYMTSLHWAAKRNEFEIAEKLISYGADVNAKDIIGRTPLFFAAKHRHLEMMQLLLWNLANPWSTKDMNLNEICANNPHAMIILKKARKSHIVMKMTPVSLKKQTWERQAQDILIDPATGEHIERKRKLKN